MVRQIYLKRLLTYYVAAIDDKVGFAHERVGDSKNWQILASTCNNSDTILFNQKYIE
jgi:hypothetical protein